MNYKITLLLLLIVPILNYTDLTMLNCPAQFNITAYNTTTDSTTSALGPFVYGGFSVSKDRVVTIVTKGDYN